MRRIFFSDQNVLVYIGYFFIPLVWYFINRTCPGMHLRAVGEYPAAADALGINMCRLRNFYVFVGGLLAGLAGATISLAVSPGWFSELTTAGLGWIVVCLVIFAQWTPSRDTQAKNLSGGNIQKVGLARELSRNPRAIIAAQPTRGLDIGATEYVREQLQVERHKGAAILLISEDLDEILALSDRIAVLYEGQIMDIVSRESTTPQRLGLLMAGVLPEKGTFVAAS